MQRLWAPLISAVLVVAAAAPVFGQRGGGHAGGGFGGGGFHGRSFSGPSFSGSRFSGSRGFGVSAGRRGFGYNRGYYPHRGWLYGWPYGYGNGYGYGAYLVPNLVGYPFGFDLWDDDFDDDGPGPQGAYASPYDQSPAGSQPGSYGPPYAEAGQPPGYGGAPPPEVAEGQPAEPEYRPAYTGGALDTGASSAVQQPVHPQPATTLIFNDGRANLQVHNYILTRKAIFDLDGGGDREIPLSEINLAATTKTNHAAGVDFNPPKPANFNWTGTGNNAGR